MHDAGSVWLLLSALGGRREERTANTELPRSLKVARPLPSTLARSPTALHSCLLPIFLTERLGRRPLKAAKKALLPLLDPATPALFSSAVLSSNSLPTSKWAPSKQR